MSNVPNPTEQPAAELPAFTAGQKLASCYVLKEVLSAGGENLIWAADDEVLGKPITLHFVPGEVLKDAAALAELRQEVKRNRPLILPGVLRVYDLVEEPGWTAVSMDGFSGKSLASLLKEKGKYDAEELQQWLPKICQILEDAHKINIVHRDLSPANIFITEEGQPLITGFGISRVIQDALSRAEPPQITPSHRASLSPQLLDGKTPARTDDVYGVGALGFELLTGNPLFTKGDIATQIRQTPPPTVSQVRSISRTPAAAMPAAWNETIAACLSKTPEGRPATAAEVARRLSANAEETPATAPAAAAAATTAAVAATSEIPAPATPAPEPTPTSPTPTEAAIAAITAATAPQETPAPAAEAPAPVTEAPKIEEVPAKKPVDALLEKAAQAKQAAPETPAEPKSEPKPEPELRLEGQARRETKPPVEASGGWPVSPGTIAAAAALIVVGGFSFYLSSKPETPSNEVAVTATPTLEPAPVNLPVATPAPEPPPIVPAPPKELIVNTTPSTPTPAPAPATDLPKEPTPTLPTELPLFAQANPETDRVNAGPAHAPSVTQPPKSTATGIDLLREEATNAGKAVEEQSKLKAAAEAAVTQTKKSIEEKTKAVAPARKAAGDLLKDRKKKEDEQKTTEAAALQAMKVAEEKAKAAESAKQALVDFDDQNKEKLGGVSKIETELKDLQRMLEENQKHAAATTQATADAEAEQQKKLGALKQAEQQIADAESAKKKAAEDEQKKRAAMDSEKKKLDDELASMRAMFEQRMKDLEDRRKQLEGSPTTPSVAAPPAPAPVVPAATPVVKAATPAPATPPPATPALVQNPLPLPLPAAAPTTPVPATPAPATPTQLAMKTEPVKPTATPEPAKPALGSGTNSLGMKFTTVGDVQFSLYQTRVQDFEAFAKATNLKSSAWRGPGFKQGPDHPVVNVTWNEALAFCKWLTDKEHKEGSLPPNSSYRLPTDLEWSKAVGLPDEVGKTPEARDMGVPDVYPWGSDWPPPKGSGNYTGEETGSDVAIKGYEDGFAWTAPVGSFAPNKFGLYDMGGNVWQWCMDSWNNDSKAKVLRGASWYNGALKLSLLSSCRVHAAPDSSTDNYGFRIVKASDSGAKTTKK